MTKGSCLCSSPVNCEPRICTLEALRAQLQLHMDSEAHVQAESHSQGTCQKVLNGCTVLTEVH